VHATGEATSFTSTVTPTFAPTATPSPAATRLPLSVAEQPPLPGLSGHIVWWGIDESGAMHDLDAEAWTHGVLWADVGLGHVWGWRVEPPAPEIVYSRDGDPGEQLVARALAPGAEPRLLATDGDRWTVLASPVWSADGDRLAFLRLGLSDYDGPAGDVCEVHMVDRFGARDRVVWSGSARDPTRSFGCPDRIYWEPASGRIGMFEHAFEDPISRRFALLDQSGPDVVQPMDLQVESRAHAQSPDRIWLAILESASYYGMRYPFLDAMHVDEERWPGEARVRLLNLVNGGVLDIVRESTAVGFTWPVWAPDGTWLAFAQKTGTLAPATPGPPAAAYPGHASPAPRPTLSVTGVRIRAVSREGRPLLDLPLDTPDAWPVAVSPDGRFVLVAQSSWRTPSTHLFAYRIADGAGGLVATFGAAEPFVAWVP